MNKNPFSYSAIILGSINETANEYTYILEHGMSFANSYADAASILESYYGDDLITIKDLTLYEESPVILTTQEQIKNYANSNAGLDYNQECDINGNVIIGEKNAENL